MVKIMLLTSHSIAYRVLYALWVKEGTLDDNTSSCAEEFITPIGRRGYQIGSNNDLNMDDREGDNCTSTTTGPIEERGEQSEGLRRSLCFMFPVLTTSDLLSSLSL